MLFNVIQRYSILCQNICASVWLFQLFLVPLRHQTCFTKNQSSCNIPTHIPILIPTPFSPPGPPPRSGTCAPRCIASTDVPSGRSKYYLPTLRAALNCPFSLLLSPLKFPALKLGLSFLETKTFQP